MCSIFGALFSHCSSLSGILVRNQILNHISLNSNQRGRDGFGYQGWNYDDSFGEKWVRPFMHGAQETHKFYYGPQKGAVIGNWRAEPTTEFVDIKRFVDQQPYTAGKWSIVHNGTIANDKELRTWEIDTRIDSAAIAELLGNGFGEEYFHSCMATLKGSFAILAYNSEEVNTLYVACNYRPIWMAKHEGAVYFASARDYFPKELAPVMIQPYTTNVFTAAGNEIHHRQRTLRPAGAAYKALVVCSGGLDSVVAAKYAQNQLDMDITLIHFRYGSRAEGPEVAAIQKIAAELGVKLVLFPLPIYDKKDSPLLDPDSTVAGGEEGAEFAHEWVPARNLVMLSVATAYAEANGFDHIVLGNNLEEAGAYPDNEPEFINKFNDLLPFAVGDGKHVKVIMPVGNLMKHEIVKLGLDIGAPLHLTWSCYRAGEKHCGTCGPCYMRRKAFEINKAQEVIEYEHD